MINIKTCLMKIRLKLSFLIRSNKSAPQCVNSQKIPIQQNPKKFNQKSFFFRLKKGDILIKKLFY